MGRFGNSGLTQVSNCLKSELLVPMDCCSPRFQAAHCFRQHRGCPCAPSTSWCHFSYMQITLCMCGSCISVCGPWCGAYVRVAHWKMRFDYTNGTLTQFLSPFSNFFSFAPFLCVYTQAYGAWVSAGLVSRKRAVGYSCAWSKGITPKRCHSHCKDQQFVKD